eukprot:scaffold10082_cov115-Isochrysis_galbana.AAC.5
MLADGRSDHAREQGALVGRDACELGRLGLFLIPEFLLPFILPHCLVPVARRRAVRLEVGRPDRVEVLGLELDHVRGVLTADKGPKAY